MNNSQLALIVRLRDLHFHVFISHASEDNETVAEPLANLLKQLGLSVWYDGFSLKLGDRLTDEIDSSSGSFLWRVPGLLTDAASLAIRMGVRGREIARLLQPEEKDYFVLKPKHSGFFSTNLDILLDYLGVETLILTGIAANICVLFTANDAYMRDFNLVVPADCVASNGPEENDHALEQIRKVLKAEITPSTALDLEALKRRAAQQPAAPKPQPHAEHSRRLAHR